MIRRDVICHLMAATFGLLIVTPPAVMLFDRRDPAELVGGEFAPNDVRPGDTVLLTGHGFAPPVEMPSGTSFKMSPSYRNVERSSDAPQ